jgi:hypothetical protein
VEENLELTDTTCEPRVHNVKLLAHTLGDIVGKIVPAGLILDVLVELVGDEIGIVGSGGRG